MILPAWESPTRKQTISRILKNGSGGTVEVLSYGARIASIWLPSRTGMVNVVLGYPDSTDYLHDRFYMGCAAGRYCNRIGQGQFSVGNSRYQLSQNEGVHHLHGGARGISHHHWQLSESSTNRAQFQFRSADGDEGYPGNVEITARYTWDYPFQLTVEYIAVTDKTTPLNLTNHSYFNLGGGERDILDHHVQLHADQYTPVTPELIPTGEIRDVALSPFDLRSPTRLSSVLARSDDQLLRAKGFDHNFVVRDTGKSLNPVASVVCHRSGVAMNVRSNQPGVQLYTGQHLENPFRKHQGLCLETQNFPDAPNHPDFPSAMLEPGKVYHAKTVFEFNIN
ncbi:MAG: aldose epimerase family protein [bacterium]